MKYRTYAPQWIYEPCEQCNDVVQDYTIQRDDDQEWGQTKLVSVETLCCKADLVLMREWTADICAKCGNQTQLTVTNLMTDGVLVHPGPLCLACKDKVVGVA